MSVSRRYQPSMPSGDAAMIGIDASDVLPLGVAITTASLTILTNTSPALPTTDFTQGEVLLLGRQAWCQLAGGAPGTDYQCRWILNDSQGHTWQRTALLLCAETS